MGTFFRHSVMAEFSLTSSVNVCGSVNDTNRRLMFAVCMAMKCIKWNTFC